MYKLSNDYIDKMISNHLTSKEIDCLLYIARMQDESGKIYSVYYKEVCEQIKISVQKFYDIIKSLESKNLIMTEKTGTVDIRITLIGNDFTNQDYEKGYYKVVKIDHLSDDFLKLKAGSKLLYLYMQRFTNGRHGFLHTLYQELCKKLGVKKKAVQHYLHELKAKRFLYVSVKRNKAYNYELCILNSKEKHSTCEPSEGELKRSNFKSCIVRNFKKFLPKDQQKTTRCLDNLAMLTTHKKFKEVNNYFDILLKAVQESINLQYDEDKKHPVLNAALVNQCLSSMELYC